jgi:hypothetical protein
LEPIFNEVDGEAIHRLDQLPIEKSYTISIGEFSFCFNQPQLLLISLTAFEHFGNTSDPFENVIASYLDLEQVAISFQELYSLFSKNSVIDITFQNVRFFEFLAEQLDNVTLLNLCQQISSTQSLIFKISFTRFQYFSQKL